MQNNINNHAENSLSLWMDIKIPENEALKDDISADVCIIGSGIAGLTCAYLLAKKGKSVIVLDKDGVAASQSARTTAHLTWVLDKRYFELEGQFGLENTKMVANSYRQAIDSIENMIKEEKIDCDFERVDAYLFPGPQDSTKILDKELKCINDLGLPVEKLARFSNNFMGTLPCLRFPNQAQFHVLKYLMGLIASIKRNGGKIFSDTVVTAVEDGDICKVTTAQGNTISAQSVIVCTNTPINNRFFTHTKQAPYRSYVIAAKLPKGSLPQALYYDTCDPYHYIRFQKHSTDPKYVWIIIGGEDHKAGQEKNILKKYALLEQWAREKIPNMEKVEYQWSGQLFEPADGLPFVGKNLNEENVYIATGASGNGMTQGTIAGLLITDLILKKQHPWEELYKPTRKCNSSLLKCVNENLNAVKQYVDWVTPAEVDSIEEIKTSTGAIVRDGLKKIAVYRDNEGKCHYFSAKCPHLGCIVRWNEGEKTWDCPCHGSCFSCEGKVLIGPAVANLEEISPETEKLKDK